MEEAQAAGIGRFTVLHAVFWEMRAGVSSAGELCGEVFGCAADSAGFGEGEFWLWGVGDGGS